MYYRTFDTPTLAVRGKIGFRAYASVNLTI